MRIGLFSDTYLPDINGVVTSVELTRKKLEERGHTAFVICTHPGLLKVVKEGNVIRLPGVVIKKLYGYAITSPIHPFIYDDIQALDLDLIHIHTEFGVGIFAEMCAERFHLPIVRTYHTTYEDYTHYVNFLDLDVIDKYGKKAIAGYSRFLSNRAVKMISPSKKTAELLEKYGVKTDIEIIPTGTELYRFEKKNTTADDIKRIRQEVGLKDGYKLILYVGRIAQEKSLDVLIRSFKVLKKQNAKMKLVIIGGGPQLDELIAYSKKEELDDYIYFGNKRPFEVIPHYYHSADAFVSASTSETQGMTYIEAMASGLVVFARRDECVKDLIRDGENGYYFDDEEELVKKLQVFSELSTEKIASMGDLNQKIAKSYDADTFADRIVKVYTDAIREYAESYTLQETKLKNDYIELILAKGDRTCEDVVISLDEFYERGLRKGNKITQKELEDIKKSENRTKAYRGALRRLAARDYCEKEMSNYLTTHFDIDDRDLQEIMRKLQKRGLLDDEKYAIGKISQFRAKFLSQKRIIQNLKKVGVSDDIITKVITYDEDEEFEKALKKAYSYQSTIKNHSLNHKKQMIVKKLIADGFSSDLAQRAIDSLDFSSEVFKESEVLRKEAAKLYKNYKRKYTGSMLRNKIFQGLVMKGFNYDDIYAIMNEVEDE